MLTKINQTPLSYLISFIGGLLYAIAFPVEFMFSIPFAHLIGVIFLFYNIFNTNLLTTKIIHFLIFSLGAYFLGYYWIPNTIYEFGRIIFPFNQLLGILFSIIILPQFLIIVFSSNYILKINMIKKLSYISYPLIALILALIEHLTPSQFPTFLAHPFGFMAPYLGMAPIFGTIIFSFISFWLILSITIKPLQKKEIVISSSLFALLIFANIITPLNKLSSPNGPVKNLNVRMVQANIGNFLKLSSENGNINSLSKVIEHYQNMSMSNSSLDLDLIIWPETAYPRTIYTKYMLEDRLLVPEVFNDIAKVHKADFFIGGYDYERIDNNSYFETEYNAAFFFKHLNTNKLQFRNTYHKMILLAFGETLPFGPLTKYISKFIRNVSYFKRGNTYSLFKTKKNSYFISSICYEILRPNFTRKYLNSTNHEPHFIINLTNDSWFGISSEPYQHLFLSKWRAYEFKIPIIRMTNTGISSIIYPDGSESTRTKLNTSKNLDLKFEFTDRNSTIYQQYGYLPFALFFFFILIFTSLIQFFIEKPSRTKS